MLAVLQTQAGDASTLYLGETARPQAGPGQLLLHVHAAGINRADIVQREGRYPAPAGASPLLGLGSGVCGREPDAMHMCDDTYAAATVGGTALAHLVIATTALVGVIVATVRRTPAWPWPVAAGALMAGVVVLAIWLASR